jgi:putative ABC transport system substrate-binding protein
MNRREFVAGLGALAVFPFPARAQQSTIPVIGFLSSRSPDESAAVVSAFRRGLADAGYVVGQNVTIEYRWAEGSYDRLSGLAAELVNMPVAVLLAAGGPPAALAAKQATSTIPVIFSAADDPVGLGLVASFNRPGGNVTGMSLFNSRLGSKRLAILHELIPSAKSIAYLSNPANPSAQLERTDVEGAAKALGVELHVLDASSDKELEAAFAKLAELHAGGMVVAGEPFLDSRRQMIVDLTAQYAIPASYSWRESVVLGGLVSYGTSITGSYRNAGGYCARVLKGEKPGDLPVMQPTQFETIINLKTAKALGLHVPSALLASADEVVE